MNTDGSRGGGLNLHQTRWIVERSETGSKRPRVGVRWGQGNLIHPVEMMGGGSRDEATPPSGMTAPLYRLHFLKAQKETGSTPGNTRLKSTAPVLIGQILVM